MKAPGMGFEPMRPKGPHALKACALPGLATPALEKFDKDEDIVCLGFKNKKRGLRTRIIALCKSKVDVQAPQDSRAGLFPLFAL